MWAEIDRVVEPFVKAAFSNWLVLQGASQIVVSVDGMEPRAAEFPAYLEAAGFRFTRSQQSKAKWVGKYVNGSEIIIETCSRPGVDIRALSCEGELLVAECKGEPTKSGVGAGADLTALYQCLGQLIVSAGNMAPIASVRYLVIPESDRLRPTIEMLSVNPLLKAAGIRVATVDRFGKVKVLM